MLCTRINSLNHVCIKLQMFQTCKINYALARSEIFEKLFTHNLKKNQVLNMCIFGFNDFCMKMQMLYVCRISYGLTCVSLQLERESIFSFGYTFYKVKNPIQKISYSCLSTCCEYDPIACCQRFVNHY